MSDTPNSTPGGDRDRGAIDGSLPAELRGIGRLLDARGVRERGRLRSDALERIIAASDFQRPLELGDVRPVIGRIGPTRATRMPLWMPHRTPQWRLAAAIAALVGLGAVIIVALSVGGDARDAAVGPSNTLVDSTDRPDGGSERPRSSVGDRSRTESALAVGGFEHFDSIFEEGRLDGGGPGVTDVGGVGRGVSRPAASVIAALADGGSSALALVGVVGGDEALATELVPLLAAGSASGASAIRYDDLSDELASIVTRTAAPR